jgi:hypothetical protein
LTPCIALLPLTFAAVKYGTMAVILVNVSFTIGTVLTIMLFTWLGLKGIAWIKLEFFDEYGDILAGVIIGLLGIAPVSVCIRYSLAYCWIEDELMW